MLKVKSQHFINILFNKTEFSVEKVLAVELLATYALTH